MNCIGKIYQLILYVNTWSVSKAVVRVPAKNVDNNSCQNKERRNIFLKFDSNYSYPISDNILFIIIKNEIEYDIKRHNHDMHHNVCV